MHILFVTHEKTESINITLRFPNVRCLGKFAELPPAAQAAADVDDGAASAGVVGSEDRCDGPDLGQISTAGD